MSLGEGSQFAGYTVLRLLGAGGMGEVFMARHPRLPRYDALKILRTDLSADAGFRHRFLREADLAATLNHPNIVTVYDRGETEDGQLWIAMEFVDGPCAGDLTRAALPSAWVSHLIGEVAKGLDYAHSHRVLHRDIKPANFLLTGADQRVLLADFGIARAFDDATALTATGSLVATAAYAAPEVIEGQPADHHADIYGLGCSLFRLLTGRVPFDDRRGIPAMLVAHVTAPIPRASEIAEDLPSAVDDVIAQALAKNPADRFDTAGALADAAAVALIGTSTTAPPRIGGTETRDWQITPPRDVSHPEPRSTNTISVRELVTSPAQSVAPSGRDPATMDLTPAATTPVDHIATVRTTHSETQPAPTASADQTHAAPPASADQTPLAAATAHNRTATDLSAARGPRHHALIAVSVVALLAVVATVGFFAISTIKANNVTKQAARDREAARLAGQHYLESLAAGDARTALFLGTQQPANQELLTDKVLRAQLAATPITDIAVTNDPSQEPTTPADAQHLILAAKFGNTDSKTTMWARRKDGHWKLDTTIIAINVDKPTNSTEAINALAIGGVSTEGTTPVWVFPGTVQVSSANRYIDITADTKPLLLEALSETAARPSIQPSVALNEAGRQATVAAANTRLHHCFHGTKPPQECCDPDGCRALPGSTPGINDDSVKLLNLESTQDMTYDLDANALRVRVTGTLIYSAEGLRYSRPLTFRQTMYIHGTVDLTKEPPVTVHER
ncbi:protein kinase (plasmid) [Mycobacterium marinum]|uniref:serine/threonine-protein kinase n=2 Tax=Mycobacterium marinum TaxID=1781 RepID=UPI00045FE24C|nr:serine/threonine-protein kinase [Mycobacterium marinum]WCS21230.1 protein kinase [Mycobacterium marinum]WOR07589.1 protein kinase [Mycobacterium marinum]CDM79528.1 serine/threonine-protein kinase [Mycobacterium marinum E11]BBC69139.1 hypothetical protein MMRN_p1080 [Mycobacterium marinum]GJO46690.1 hypothetical protein NJB1604_27120 [Mycobacterium marinum]